MGEERGVLELRERIVWAARMRSSAAGNPRFAVRLSNGQSLTTAPDTADAYEVENYLNSGDVALVRVQEGQIINIQPVKQ